MAEAAETAQVAEVLKVAQVAEAAEVVGMAEEAEVAALEDGPEVVLADEPIVLDEEVLLRGGRGGASGYNVS